ncbi:CxC2 domain-containing protein [Mycena chlorophos]|uniref:CxC2 domain-containing protein n=1 Tax=Mycena chlorophos TaxID=658473 RepID=A0A8H6VQN0_MYCCL|nr:CxC2 domain-containing protein [Mycena chlorophos]
MAAQSRVHRFAYYEENADFVHTDEQVHISADKRRSTTMALNLSPPKKPKLATASDSELARWTPVEGDIGETQAAVAATITASEVVLEEEITAKRKRYDSDDPMAVWRPLVSFFLNEMCRRDGFGLLAHCSLCLAEVNPLRRFFRCAQCGDGLFCENCVRYQHSRNPLHAVEMWTGEFWDQISLHHQNINAGGIRGLGEVYQLGHNGDVCPCPGARRSMVVIDVYGVVNVDLSYCDCRNTDGTDSVQQLLRAGWYPATTERPSTCATFEVLEMFRLLRAVGNVNVQNFVRTLERRRNPTQTAHVPDRAKEFSRMSRQFDFLKRLKRAGRGHEADGVARTKPGAVAVRCWACPEDGRNLPDGWREVHPEKRQVLLYLYQLFLSIDGNFRLKNRMRPNERDDPSLGPGLGYFVESTPYKQHLLHYVSEKDISTCASFQALKQKDTRLTRGLRVTGVVGVVCSRHGLVRRRGLGDLQRGERYANVDWIVLCTLWMERLLKYGFAYDIACQWLVHFFERIDVIQQRGGNLGQLATELEAKCCQFGLPVWHAGAHDLQCRAQLALAYLLGFGKTDGEAAERIWASLNPAAWATKEMGEGARQDVLEDKIDFLNFEKNNGLGKALVNKLVVALAERRRQGLEFAELDQSPTRQKKTHLWYEEEQTVEGPSEHAIAEDLKKSELDEIRAGRVSFDGKMTVAAFVRAGLQLEEIQRRIIAALKNKNLTASRGSSIQELRVSLLKQMQTFERLQLTYMPGVEVVREADEAERNPESPPLQPEHLKLYLPSQLTASQRATSCSQRVVDAEASLRRGQCSDGLTALRTRLHAKTYLIWFRDANWRGQQKWTRSVTLMGRLEEAIARIAEKYRTARAALSALRGPDFAPEFQLLTHGDINARIETESDAAAAKKLSGADGSRPLRTQPNLSRDSEPTAVSWIWLARSAEPGAELHDSVRVQWSKARARKMRWDEEVDLIREEMKRVIRSLHWVQREWQHRVDAVRDDVEVEIAEGLKAYALRQVQIYRRIAAGFYAQWEKSAGKVVEGLKDCDDSTEDYFKFLGVMLDGLPPAHEDVGIRK